MNQLKAVNGTRKELKIRFNVPEYRPAVIPGVAGKPEAGTVYVKVTDLPAELDNWMEINPRVPNRNKAGLLNGPVAKGILETLHDAPNEMAIMNQGIYMLVDKADYARGPSYNGNLELTFADIGKHGIINGGHTYAAIREAIENATDEEMELLKQAFVRVHIFQGIDEDYVPDIAEGLNRSKQVDDPSLANLQGEFDIIRKALKGTVGEQHIAYHQGDTGSVYVSELLVYINLFNVERFDDKVHPNGLYNRQALGLKYYTEDMEHDRAHLNQLIAKLPDFLWLADSIRLATPAAAKANKFKFGRAKISTTDRAGSVRNKGTLLPFVDQTVNYRVPNGWVYPMLAAFRANLKTEQHKLVWRMPIKELLPAVIEQLVGVCVSEHRDNSMRPELVGKRESAYAQCYGKVELYLAKKKLLE